MSADPIEFHHLAGQPEFEAVERRLKGALTDYRRQTADPFLEPSKLERMNRYSHGVSD